MTRHHTPTHHSPLTHSLLTTLIVGLISYGLGSIGPTARTAEPDAKASDAVVASFFTTHCKGCHAGEKPKGNFRLESLTQDFNDKANRERWLAVVEQVASGAMPPKGKPRPPEKDVAAFTDWIRGRVESGGRRAECGPGAGPAAPTQPGRVREHRARPAGRRRRPERRAAARTRRRTGLTTVPRRCTSPPS